MIDDKEEDQTEEANARRQKTSSEEDPPRAHPPGTDRAIDQRTAVTILEAIHRYADIGAGRVKPLSGEFEGFLRLRIGNHRVFFRQTADTITMHRVRDPRIAVWIGDPDLPAISLHLLSNLQQLPCFFLAAGK